MSTVTGVVAYVIKMFSGVYEIQTMTCPVEVQLVNCSTMMMMMMMMMMVVEHCTAGDEDVGSSGVRVRRSVAAISRVRRVQFIRQSSLQESLVHAVLSIDGLHQQRHQSNPLQRHVRQVLPGLPSSTALR